MNRFIVRHALKPLACIAFCFSLFSYTAPSGGESYRIYLNNKLIMEQFVLRPVQVENLQLDNANSKDVLVIYYNHCGAPGNGRSITIRDTQGNILKEWKFADAENASTGMIIPVKEILALQKSNARLNLYYSSRQIPGARMLTAMTLGEGRTAGKFVSHQ